ncbi:MAG: SPFH domain-containing protein [Anaerolineae bacterium]|nr:SPFH domain-containing protein [Anaerolineae bacterium]
MDDESRRTLGPPVSAETRDASRVWPLLIFALLLALYWFMAWLIVDMRSSLSVPAFWQNITNLFPLMGGLTQPITYAASFFSPLVLRNFIPVIGGALFAYLTTTTLLKALYDLADMNEARAFLGRLQTGSGKTVTVNRETLSVKRVAEPLLRIGGPGTIRISDNEVLVTELNGRFNRVLGPGVHRLARFEYMRIALDLREQERSRDHVHLTTREGIQITTDVHVTFRLRRGNRTPTRSNPFPFDPDSVRLAAYHETVLADGTIANWEQLPLETAIRCLQDKVQQLRLDQLVDPHHRQVDPQPTIQTGMQRETRHALLALGIELIGARLGALHLPPDVNETLLAYWNTFSERPQPVEKPTQAELDARHAVARARIRERMIQSIAQGLAQVQQRSSQTALSREVVMAYRLVDTIDRLIQLPEGRDGMPRELVQILQQARNTLLEDSRVDRPHQLDSGITPDAQDQHDDMVQ